MLAITEGMVSKKYVVKLSAEERETLKQVIRKGKSAAWKEWFPSFPRGRAPVASTI